MKRYVADGYGQRSLFVPKLHPGNGPGRPLCYLVPAPFEFGRQLILGESVRLRGQAFQQSL
jgi:hypothetical protein